MHIRVLDISDLRNVIIVNARTCDERPLYSSWWMATEVEMTCDIQKVAHTQCWNKGKPQSY